MRAAGGPTAMEKGWPLIPTCRSPAGTFRRQGRRPDRNFNRRIGRSHGQGDRIYKKCQDQSGKFAYKLGGGGKPSLTGTGVLCLQIWKNAKSEEAKKGLEWIVANQAKDWKDETFTNGTTMLKLAFRQPAYRGIRILESLEQGFPADRKRSPSIRRTLARWKTLSWRIRYLQYDHDHSYARGVLPLYAIR